MEKGAAISIMPTPLTFTLREAARADAPGILGCLAEAFEPYRHAYTTGAFADTVLTAEALERRFGCMTILVATVAGESVVGTISWSRTRNDEGHLRGMAVRSAWQGCGVASQLLALAEAMLRAEGCRRAALDTTEPLTRAMAFYRRHGYSSTGRTEDFFGMPLHEFAKDLNER